MTNAECRMLKKQMKNSAFVSTFGIRHSAFGIRHSALTVN